MKKIYIILSAAATVSFASTFTSCSNAEEVKKQQEEQAAKIQMMADEKLNALQEEVTAECASLVDSLANVQYAEFLASAKKGVKRAAPKPKPVAPAKKEEPKKPETKADKMGGTTNTTNTAADKASKMGGTTNTVNTPSDKASKMGGTQPK